MAKVLSNEGSAKGGMFAKGGDTHMHKQSGATPRDAGQTDGVDAGKGSMFASGGKTGMAPNRGSVAAAPGKTSAY